MKFRLKWSELDYSMDYTKKLPPPQINNIKVTKIDKYICGPEELIACPQGAECAPAVWGPTYIVLFQPQTTRKQMPQSRAHVWQSCVARDSTPGNTCCTAGSGPRGPRGVQPVPGHWAIQVTV